MLTYEGANITTNYLRKKMQRFALKYQYVDITARYKYINYTERSNNESIPKEVNIKQASSQE